MKKLRPILKLKKVKVRRYNAREETDERILKYQQLINGEEYLNKAIINIADRLARGLQITGDQNETK